MVIVVPSLFLLQRFRAHRAQPPAGDLTNIWRCGCSFSRSAHCQTLYRHNCLHNAYTWFLKDIFVWNLVRSVKSGSESEHLTFWRYQSAGLEDDCHVMMPCPGMLPPTWRRNRTTRWHHVCGTSGWEVGRIKGRWMPETACRKIPQHFHTFSIISTNCKWIEGETLAAVPTSVKPPDENHSSQHERIFVVLNTKVKFKTQLEKWWNMGSDWNSRHLWKVPFWSILFSPFGFGFDLPLGKTLNPLRTR